MDWKKPDRVKKSLGASTEEGDEIKPAPDKEEPENPVDELNKPSPGQELIERIKKEDSIKKEETKKEEAHIGNVIEGVEVINVKAVPKKEPLQLNKFGIPEPKERLTWDKI